MVKRKKGDEKWKKRARARYNAACDLVEMAERRRLIAYAIMLKVYAEHNMECPEATYEDYVAASTLPTYYRAEAKDESFRRRLRTADTIGYAVMAAIICGLGGYVVAEGTQLISLGEYWWLITTACAVGGALIVATLCAFFGARSAKRSFLATAKDIEGYLETGYHALPDNSH